ncbi:MAG: luciferase [Candidatus Saccharibacteria bacterium]|nr:luciferase [Candidatus Saccharibacteria bacterium]
MEFGVCTFADLAPDAETGKALSPEQRMKNLLEEMVLADKVGLNIFGVGEHHRPDFIVSDPAVVMAAGAAITKKIRFTSAVTVLSTRDPVQVFQEFSEVDLVSGGRAEIIAGRGSFTESFPLFGYSLEDYDELFMEKLGLLLMLRESEKVQWTGKHRAPIDNLGVYPRPVQNPLPVWIGSGGNPPSAIRAGALGLPLVLAIIGGRPDQFVRTVELYREAARQAGHDPKKLQVAINSHGYIADDSKQAADEYFPAYSYMMNQIGRDRGWSPMTREAFEVARSPEGFMFVGTPEEVAEKILYEHKLFGHQRFLMQSSIGSLPHDKTLHAIELLGTKVAPMVRKELKKLALSLG